MTKPLGLETKRDRDIVFLQIKDQSICEYSKMEREGYEPIEVRNPQTKEDLTRYIKRYEGINAYVDEIEFRNEEHQSVQYISWKLHLDCGTFQAVLEIPFQSAPSSRFQKTAENLDFTKPVHFRAFTDPARKNATAFMMSQDDKNVPQRYTKEEPNGLPEPTKGISGMNYIAQEAFLWQRMNDVVIPACAAAAAARKGEPESEDDQHPADSAPGNPAEQPESSETARWTPPSTAKPTETATAPASPASGPPSELAAIVTKVKMLAAGKGIPNLDAFIKAVLTKDTPAMATVAEANEVLAQLKAL